MANIGGNINAVMKLSKKPLPPVIVFIASQVNNEQPVASKIMMITSTFFMCINTIMPYQYINLFDIRMSKDNVFKYDRYP